MKHKGSIETLVKEALRRWNRDSSSSTSPSNEESKEQATVGDKDRKEFEFVDAKTNARLCVIAELTQTAVRGAVTLTFYVPYWIYDLTSLTLIPSQDKTKKNAPAGISQGQNQG